MRNILLKMTIGYATVLAAQAASPGTCNLDLPLQWTIQPVYTDGTTPNLIVADGSPYVNGQSGVLATINVCAGTNDAVLQFGSRSSRSFSVIFSKPLATNSSTPSWASGSVSGQGVLNVRNITYVPAGLTRVDEYVFTTRSGSSLPVKGSWNFRMWNPATQAAASTDPAVAASTDPAVAAANSPYTDSLVYAHHCPANSTASTGPCVGIVQETWFVFADGSGTGTSSQTGLPLTQVGGLQNTQSNTPVNAGQFSIPFFYVISRLP